MIMQTVFRCMHVSKLMHASRAIRLQHSCYNVNGGIVVVHVADAGTSIATPVQILLATTVVAQEYSRSRIWSWCLHEGFTHDLGHPLVSR
jgi:hypothetical protein